MSTDRPTTPYTQKITAIVEKLFPSKTEGEKDVLIALTELYINGANVINRSDPDAAANILSKAINRVEELLLIDEQVTGSNFETDEHRNMIRLQLMFTIGVAYAHSSYARPRMNPLEMLQQMFENMTAAADNEKS